jgi:glycopeptide antibiotics resistance protein
MTEFCGKYHLVPQLNPLQFIADIRNSGLTAVLQIVANVVFFVPLGYFLRNLFGRKIFGTILAALGISLLIETAQLTGVFGIFECSYRLFDVNDLMWNVLGAVFGYLIARALPNVSRPEKKKGINTNPGGVERLVLFAADYMVVELLTLLMILPMYLMDGPWVQWKFPAYFASFVILQFVVPMTMHGQTLFGKLAGVSLDDKNRRPIYRTVFYAIRVTLLWFVVAGGSLYSGLMVPVIVLWWLVFRKMPYKILDVFFAKEPKKKK